jgi:hypothetical protein
LAAFISNSSNKAHGLTTAAVSRFLGGGIVLTKNQKKMKIFDIEQTAYNGEMPCQYMAIVVAEDEHQAVQMVKNRVYDPDVKINVWDVTQQETVRFPGQDIKTADIDKTMPHVHDEIFCGRGWRWTEFNLKAWDIYDNIKKELNILAEGRKIFGQMERNKEVKDHLKLLRRQIKKKHREVKRLTKENYPYFCPFD